MHIIQITDLHLTKDPKENVREVSTHEALKRVNQAIKKINPDLVVITGDVAADDPDSQIYENLFSLMEAVEVPWVVQKGNHDRCQFFAHSFKENAREGFSRFPINEAFEGIFFDSSAEAMPISDIVQLESYFSETDKSTVLFTHYPPINVGHPLFDETYYLKWRERLVESLRCATKPCSIFFGHIHFEFFHKEGLLSFYGTPSASLPILPGHPDFCYDPKGCYYRSIFVKNNQLKTEVFDVPLAPF